MFYVSIFSPSLSDKSSKSSYRVNHFRQKIADISLKPDIGKRVLGILLCTGIELVINNHAILTQVKGVNDLTAREFFLPFMPNPRV